MGSGGRRGQNSNSVFTLPTISHILEAAYNGFKIQARVTFAGAELWLEHCNSKYNNWQLKSLRRSSSKMKNVCVCI